MLVVSVPVFVLPIWIPDIETKEFVLHRYQNQTSQTTNDTIIFLNQTNNGYDKIFFSSTPSGGCDDDDDESAIAVMSRGIFRPFHVPKNDQYK